MLCNIHRCLRWCLWSSVVTGIQWPRTASFISLSHVYRYPTEMGHYQTGSLWHLGQFFFISLTVGKIQEVRREEAGKKPKKSYSWSKVLFIDKTRNVVELKHTLQSNVYQDILCLIPSSYIYMLCYSVAFLYFCSFVHRRSCARPLAINVAVITDWMYVLVWLLHIQWNRKYSFWTTCKTYLLSMSNTSWIIQWTYIWCTWCWLYYYFVEQWLIR